MKSMLLLVLVAPIFHSCKSLPKLQKKNNIESINPKKPDEAAATTGLSYEDFILQFDLKE